MKIPRYWAKDANASDLRMRNPATGEPLRDPFSCWGWSDISVEEAEEKARQRTKVIAEMIRSGKRPDSYLYGDRPMREEIIDEWQSDDSTTYAAITLNAYGCQVLNTASIMFVDVDFTAVSALESLKYRITRLFGSKEPSPAERQESDALAKVDGMVQTNPGLGIRAYRTRAGLRYLFTNCHVDPVEEPTLSAMEALGVDPLYLRLCRVQECFRARLTPKPWRCGAKALGVRYPWQDASSEKKARSWIAAYSRKAEAYATCSFIQQYGSDTMDQEIARVVAFHDTTTKAQSDLKLA